MRTAYFGDLTSHHETGSGNFFSRPILPGRVWTTILFIFNFVSPEHYLPRGITKVEYFPASEMVSFYWKPDENLIFMEFSSFFFFPLLVYDSYRNIIFLQWWLWYSYF